MWYKFMTTKRNKNCMKISQPCIINYESIMFTFSMTFIVSCAQHTTWSWGWKNIYGIICQFLFLFLSGQIPFLILKKKKFRVWIRVLDLGFLNEFSPTCFFFITYLFLLDLDPKKPCHYIPTRLTPMLPYWVIYVGHLAHSSSQHARVSW